jgi:hypothetical protein
MSAFRSSHEMFLFSSNCNQIKFEWSVVVAVTNKNFPENPSSGGQVIQCGSTGRRTDKINLSYFRSCFAKVFYNVRMTAAGITSLLYVIMFNNIVSVSYYFVELRFLQQDF